MINTIRRKLDEYRASIFALTLLQAFMMAGGAEAVESRQQGKLLAEAESSQLARTFGVPFERWQPDDPSWLEQSRVAVVEAAVMAEVGEIVDHSRSEMSRLIDELTAVDPDQITTALAVTARLAQDAGPAGSADDAADTHHKPRYIPKRPALDAGEGERTVDRRPLATKAQTSLKAQTSDVLPLHRVVRKARTVEASSLPAAKRDQSAIAAASPPATVAARKAAKAIAPEIVALAASLENSPSKIFRYVHDQITYDPKWGADTPPLGTVWEGSGTSWDQAWLLQELLLAAGVDARLEWGEVELPTDVLMNLTGIDDPVRAGDFLTTAGLQVVLLTVGSQIVSARFPHVWVKAHLDYIPNRGARLGTPDTWIRMDPSITAHQRTDGLRLDQDVPYVLDDHLLSGTELSPRDDYETALNDHIATQGLPLANFDEAKSLNAQVAEEFPFVPGTLRAKILTTSEESETLPSVYEQEVQIQVREAGGGALLTYETTAAAIYGKRLELVWVGATSSDQATLDLYGGIYGTPPYEVNLRPTLRLDGVEVDSGNGEIGAAEDAEIQMTLTPPGATSAEDGIVTIAGWDLFAGEHGVFSLDYGRAPPELADRFALNAAAAAGDAQEVEGWKLAQAAASYLHTLGGDLPHLVDLNWHRLITFNTAIFAVQRGAASTSPDGTPQTFSPGPLSLDVGAMPLAVMPVDGVQISTVPTMNLVGSQGSFREGEALASVFGGEHLTGVTFLTRAVREGQTVTKVDATNLDAALGASDISSDAKGAVRYAVEQFGFEAWIPEEQIESNTFQTTGYILLNPISGAGGYFVTFERRFTPLDGAVTFHNPIDLDVITAPTDVIATIDAEGIENWTLSTRPTGGSASTLIATGTGPVENTVLGQFDPTLLLNGMHDIVLTGTDAAGQPVTGKITVRVEGNMKIGHFTLAFTDLLSRVSGLDIEVTRTYDSRDKELGDFGVGWSLGIRQGSYENNRPPGDGWQILNPGGQLGLPCSQIKETKSHLTIIRLSPVEEYYFRLDLDRAAITLGGCYAEAGFEYVGGAQEGSTLEILDDTTVFFENASNHLVVPDTQEEFVPQRVRLTTRDGRIFDLDLDDGVTGLEDPNGNRLTINDSGIQHSSGKSIDFERDAENRIARIVDPNGHAMSYAYDAEGNLESFTDRADATTSFTYDPGHYLRDIIAPDGVQVSRTEYDDDGRVIRHIDASGKVTTFDRDIDARREIITNRLGHSRVLEYDDHGNIERQTDELDRVTLRTFDAANRLRTETDPLGRTTTQTYSSAGDLLSIADPLGNVTTMTYSSKGEVLSVTDSRGNVVNHGYDDTSRLTRITDAAGSETLLTYSDAGHLTKIVDGTGQETTYIYDGSGNQTREVDSAGNATDWTWDGNGHRLSQSRSRTLRNGSLATVESYYTYDELGHLVEAQEADGSVTTNAYDSFGKLLQSTDPLGRARALEYDDRGNLVKTTFADSTTVEEVFDAEGRVTSTIDRAGRATFFAYDAAGQLLITTFPDGSTISYSYDLAGQMTAATDSRGNTTTFQYDAAGRKTAVTDPLGNTMAYTYDGNGNQTSFTDPAGESTTFEYDALNRLTTTTFADGTTRQATYDALGRRLSETDQAGKVTHFAYDALNRLLSVTDPLGQITSMVYDEVGNMVSRTDAMGRTTRFDYDHFGRQEARLLPDGQIETRQFHPTGTLSSQTDFAGLTRTYEFDVNDRLTRRVDPDGIEASFTYTPTGRRASMTDVRGTTQYIYDSRDRLTEKIEPSGDKLTYTYDTESNRTGISATVGGIVYPTTMVYDDANRLSSVTDFQGDVTMQAYDANGNRASQELPNGVVTTTQYDSLNRLTQLTSTGIGGVLQSYAYALDAAGQRTQITEHDGVSHDYAYDALYRLQDEEVTDSDGTLVYEKNFTYDAVGNRLSQTSLDGGVPQSVASVYDARNRLLSSGSKSYSWDVNGSLTQTTEGTDTTSYSWSFDRRLTSVTHADGTTVVNLYDADGQRVRSTLSKPGEADQVVDFLVDTAGILSHVVAEVAADLPVALYTRADNQLLSLYRVADTSKRFFLADGLGSIRALVDEAGTVTDRYTYSAFGELLEHDGTDPNPYRFAGEPFDPNVGFYHNRARWMDPSNGRFVSMDFFPGSEKDPLSLHKYLYAHANPVNMVDPLGLFGMADINAVLAVIANVMRAFVTALFRVTVRFFAHGFRIVKGAFIRLMSMIRGFPAKFVERIRSGLVVIRSATTGGWRFRLFKLAGQPGRPTFRLLEWKNIVRLELHPIRAGWPKWLFYPHGHILKFGYPLSKVHLPLVEPIVILYGLYRIAQEMFFED